MRQNQIPQWIRAKKSQDSRLKLELGQLLQKVNTVSGEFPPFAVYLEAIDKALGREEETA